MDKDFLLEQINKLFIHKTILVLNEIDLEDLVLAAVPSLNCEADELENEGNLFKANRLRALANELDQIPRHLSEPQIINLSDRIH